MEGKSVEPSIPFIDAFLQPTPKIGQTPTHSSFCSARISNLELYLMVSATIIVHDSLYFDDHQDESDYQ